MNTPEKEKITTTEHLQKIKSECERLLAIAEKRTKGEWRHTHAISGRTQVCLNNGKQISAMWNHGQFATDNAAYIAACAGAAEAGWRSTIAAIDCIEDMAEHIGNHQASLIIAAWPTELLQ